MRTVAISIFTGGPKRRREDQIDMNSQTISTIGHLKALPGRVSRPAVRRHSPTLSGSELRKIVADMIG